jgi:hypothetical protein
LFVAALGACILEFVLDSCLRGVPVKQVSVEMTIRSRAIAVLAIVLTIAAVSQIILSFVLYNQDGVDWVRNVGWIVLAISGIFDWLRIHAFCKIGGVVRGKS